MAVPQAAALAGLALALALALGALLARDWGNSTPQGPHGVARITRPVADSELVALALSRKPVLLAQSSARQWKAFERWTPEYLQSQLGNVSAYVHAESSFITLHERKPLEFVLDSQYRSHHTTKRTISLATLYNESHNDQFYHFSIAMDDVANISPALLADIQPHHQLFVGTEGRQASSRTCVLGKTCTVFETGNLFSRWERQCDRRETAGTV